MASLRVATNIIPRLSRQPNPTRPIIQHLRSYSRITASPRHRNPEPAPFAPRRSAPPPPPPLSRLPRRRPFSTSPTRSHGHVTPPKPGEELWVTFIDKDGQALKVAVSAGDNLLDVAQDNDLEMEGACGGSCACSTCHVVVQDQDYYDRMPEPDDDENDMLDLAFGLTETSRLGCQVRMSKDLDGLVVKLPSMTRNLQLSDFK